MTTVIEGRGLSSGYGEVGVIRDLDIHVAAGEVVALLGPNGAGKTTTMLTLAGVLSPTAGETRLLGSPTRARLAARARSGLSFVPEQRSVFMSLSVRDNLRLARVPVDQALTLFPELGDRLRLPAGLLSGGEQQMLTLARALSRRPKVLLADELSLGLAPMVVTRLLTAVRQAADDGVAVLLVEQHVRAALGIADRAYVMRRGQVVVSGTSHDLRSRLHEIEGAYLDQAPNHDAHTGSKD